MTCETNPDGTKCDVSDGASICSPFQLTKIGEKDNCFINSAVNESLNIAGADIHVFKLLGVHEQGKLIDLTGNGGSFSSGNLPNFPSSNAFESFVSEWRSSQVGMSVVSGAFLGYNFGIVKIPNGRNAYGIDASVRHMISTIKIKQSQSANNRITKGRIERSDNGIDWFGVAIIVLPDDDILNQISFKTSVPSRYWRLRPIEFNGNASDFWGVQVLQLMDYNEVDIYNIQDNIWLENRNREYATESITLKGNYELIDAQIELMKIGIGSFSQQFHFQIAFSDCVSLLGRPVVIGDVFELPSETQYSMTMEPIKKYLEVTDVTWSTRGYTPGWQPTMLRVIAQPMIAAEETQDIFGSMATKQDTTGLLNNDDGNNKFFQDLSNISKSVAAESLTEVPERGSLEGVETREFTEEEIQKAQDKGVFGLEKLNINPKAIYVEDGLPPNGLAYTEGDELPSVSTAKDGDYHRLTYNQLLSTGYEIPPKLWRFSAIKGQWLWVETDKRKQYNSGRPILQEYLSSPTKKSIKDINKE